MAKIADISVDLVAHMGSDNDIANAARVSFSKDAANFTDAQNQSLINYLAKHKHYSPFNHTFLTFRIKAPIFVARQLVKHKFMPWNEVSRRYVDEEPEFYIPQVRSKADNVKQGSGGVHYNQFNIQENIRDHCSDSVIQYNSLLADGVAPEIARCVLPQNMMTEWFWSGTLGAYTDMLRLRLDKHTQYESQIVATKIVDLISPLFPTSLAALLKTYDEK